MELLANPLQRSNPLLQSYKSAVRFSQISSDFQFGARIHIWFRTLTQFSRNPLELQGAFRAFERFMDLQGKTVTIQKPSQCEKREESENVTDAADEYRDSYGAGALPGEDKPHVLILLFLCPAGERQGRGAGTAANAIRSDPKATEALEPALRSASLVCFHFRASLVPCFSFQQAAMALQECKRFMESPSTVFSLRPRASDNVQALADLFGAIPGMNKPKILELCKTYSTFRELCRAARGYLDAEAKSGGEARKRRRATDPKQELEDLPNFGKVSATRLAATLFGVQQQKQDKDPHSSGGMAPIQALIGKASGSVTSGVADPTPAVVPERSSSRRRKPVLELEVPTPADAFLDVQVDFSAGAQTAHEEAMGQHGG